MPTHEDDDAEDRAFLESKRAKLIEMRLLLIERRDVWIADAHRMDVLMKHGQLSFAGVAAKESWKGAAGVSKQIAKLEKKLAKIERRLATLEDD